jgi:hypothetical protein
LAYGEDEKTSKDLLGKIVSLLTLIEKNQSQLLRSFSECSVSRETCSQPRFPL